MQQLFRITTGVLAMYGISKTGGGILILLVACLAFIGSSTALADDLVYAFRGVLPSGASSHASVSDGETFTAYFTINPFTMDSDAAPEIGRYANAVVSGTLTFSGGYVASLDFSNYDALVFDNLGGEPVDGVSVRQGFDIVFQATTRDLSTLSSDALVAGGTEFASGPDPDTETYLQLIYADAGGTIVYDATSAHNVLFRAKDSIPWRNATGSSPSPYYDLNANWLDGLDGGPPSDTDGAWFGLVGSYDVWWDSITGDRTVREFCVSDGEVSIDNRDDGTYTLNVIIDTVVEGPAELTLGDETDTVHIESGGLLIVDGELSASTGTLLTAGGAGDIGREDFGRINIDGVGTMLNIGEGGLYVGVNELGDFFVTDGAIANDEGSPRLGAFPGGNGLADISGTDSQWNVMGALNIGNFPDTVGFLAVRDGADVSVMDNIEAGFHGNAPFNEILIQNATISSGDSILIGGSGDALCSLVNSAHVTADNQIQIAPGSSIVSNGTSGIPEISAGSIVNAGQISLTADVGSDVNAAVINTGTIHSQNSSVNFFLGTVIHDGAEIRTDVDSVSSFMEAVGGAGSYTGTGSVAFGDDYCPGAGSGIGTIAAVSLEGDVFLTNASSSLNIDIASAAPDDYDRLFISGDLSLTGSNLFVNVIGDFVPCGGDVFRIIELDGIRNNIFSGLPEGTVVATVGTTDLVITYNGGDGNDIELIAESGFLLGDVNGDCEVNLLDVQPFVDLLAAGGFLPEADINGDGMVNLLDVDPFVTLLTGA